MHFAVAKVEKLSQMYRKLAVADHLLQFCDYCGCGFVCKSVVPSSAHKTTSTTFSSFTPVISVHTRTTRLAFYCNNLYLPKYKTNKLLRSFKFEGVKIWNSVPHDLRKLSFNQFQIKYKKTLLPNY